MRRITYCPRLTIAQILAWADAHHDRTGAWPRKTTGHITGTRDETWNGMHEALLKGRRSLRGGCTLATLLERHRGVRHKQHAPRFSARRIRTWAGRYRRETGRWPTVRSGPIPESPADTWGKVNAALLLGYRGLPGGQTLSALLHGRGAPIFNTRPSTPERRRPRPAQSVEEILRWADEHFRRRGAWPKLYSGPVAGSGGDTWLTVDRALRRGRRGLPGGGSLALLLARERGAYYRRRSWPKNARLWELNPKNLRTLT